MSEPKVMGEPKQQESKTAYSEPSVKELGEISEKTRSVDVPGGGDSQFSVLNPS